MLLAITAFAFAGILGRAQSLAQTAYVTHGGILQIDQGVVGIDTATNTIIARISDLNGAFRVAAIPGGSRVYVTNSRGCHRHGDKDGHRKDPPHSDG
jgi:DNA-binding beta-propeller fold protein YncE